MPLSDNYRCARSLEAIENYARADAPLTHPLEWSQLSGYPENIYGDDEKFWELVLGENRLLWGQEFRFYEVALSEWVARVPGLFFSKGSEALRTAGANQIESSTKHWETYRPLGKSEIVMGGVGTLKLPPDENGRHLVSVSTNRNASTGIPALIDPEVWDHYNLHEGDIIKLTARWHKMSLGWAERFPSIKGIPRGYLMISSVAQIGRIEHEKAPILAHPCTVMEYSGKGGVTLYDFVYSTADTSYQEYRRDLVKFFKEYKDKKERYGRYLLSADVNDPLWDAEYDSPEALRRAEPGSEAHLDILEARVYKESFKDNMLDDILQALSTCGDNQTLKRISNEAGIPWGEWFTGGSINDSAAQLLAACINKKKVDQLVDALVRDNPKILEQGG